MDATAFDRFGSDHSGEDGAAAARGVRRVCRQTDRRRATRGELNAKRPVGHWYGHDF